MNRNSKSIGAALIFLPLLVLPRSLIADVSVSDIALSGDSSQQEITKKSELFGLTEVEYQRYLDIMEGPLKHWNQNIDPVMALGIFSDGEADKKRYAELYARQEHDLISRTLRFERRYRDAYRTLYPDANIIDHDLMLPYYEHQAKKKVSQFIDDSSELYSGDRILYFAESNCFECRATVAKLQGVITRNEGVGIDIYILGAVNEQQARQWAKDNVVDVSLVKDATITINLDQGAFESVNQASDKKSSYYLFRNGSLFSVSEEDILMQ